MPFNFTRVQLLCFISVRLGPTAMLPCWIEISLKLGIISSWSLPGPISSCIASSWGCCRQQKEMNLRALITNLLTKWNQEAYVTHRIEFIMAFRTLLYLLMFRLSIYRLRGSTTIWLPRWCLWLHSGLHPRDHGSRTFQEPAIPNLGAFSGQFRLWCQLALQIWYICWVEKCPQAFGHRIQVFKAWVQGREHPILDFMGSHCPEEPLYNFEWLSGIQILMAWPEFKTSSGVHGWLYTW